jgi:elongation factor Ts
MAEISAGDVMKLRNRTGLSMMECKKALAQAEGNFDKAEEILRKQMKGKMDARTDRAAGEGRIAVAVNEAAGVAAIVELRAETDFTAKSEKFVAAAQKCADAALQASSGDVQVTPAIQAALDDLRISTGENCSFARGYKLSGATGTTAYGTYVHHDGKTGVLLQAEGSVKEDTLRDVCMHITAAVPTPQGVRAEDIPAALVEKERAFRLSQAMESGKPREIAEKMVEGGMRKYYEENALLEQPFIKDPNVKIRDLVGSKGTLLAFLRWQVGQS